MTRTIEYKITLIRPNSNGAHFYQDGTLDIPDDAPDDLIDALVFEQVTEHVSWSWEGGMHRKYDPNPGRVAHELERLSRWLTLPPPPSGENSLKAEYPFTGEEVDILCRSWDAISGKFIWKRFAGVTWDWEDSRLGTFHGRGYNREERLTWRPEFYFRPPSHDERPPRAMIAAR